MKTITLPIEFGGFSAGKTTARLGGTISRSKIDLLKADETFTQKRLTLSLVAAPKETDPSQQQLPEMQTAIQGVADVKGLRVGLEDLGIGMTFNAASIELDHLMGLRNRSGVMTITGVEDIPEDEADDDEGDVGESHGKPDRRQQALPVDPAAKDLAEARTAGKVAAERKYQRNSPYETGTAEHNAWCEAFDAAMPKGKKDIFAKAAEQEAGSAPAPAAAETPAPAKKPRKKATKK